MEPIQVNDTIAAISTPQGMGGIAVIRISGPDAISTVNKAWKGADLHKASSHSAHLGNYVSTEGNLIDQAVATIFVAPNSFTGENTVELSVHGSIWIQREILKDLVKRGIRIANPGEFTQRAFINGKIDLSQAEGIADLIASSSKAAHDIAINQTKGTFTKEFDNLREKLIEFASLLELELDFSEEDVEFADRSNLQDLCSTVLQKVDSLASSFSTGKVLKEGVPVVIAGIPNAGKSSLLNLLLGEEKAIVTDLPGTTRDIIEDTLEIDGILYRFVDTAGLRKTKDIVETIGVERAYSALEKAFITIWVIDSQAPLTSQFESFKKFRTEHPDKNFILLLNKVDLSTVETDDEAIKELQKTIEGTPIIKFSSKTGIGLQDLLQNLNRIATKGQNPENDIIVTNARHYQALVKASESLTRALDSLTQDTGNYISSDFIAQDIREAIDSLSEITGKITTDTLLHSIFSRFCIGK